MFSEPALAHPAEIGGVDATLRRSHPVEDGDREQDDADADGKQHMGVAAMERRISMLTRGTVTVCALVHTALAPRPKVEVEPPCDQTRVLI
jgi:hypothetical protein